jgi:hypothetical protein
MELELKNIDIEKMLKENTLNRKNEAEKFAEYLMNLSGGQSISLDSAWGTGKTVFVKQTMILLNKNIESSENRNASCFYFDAWAHDHHNDPLMSFVLELINHFGVKMSKSKSQKVSKFIKVITSGIPWVGEIDLENLKSDSIFTEIIGQKQIKAQVEEFISWCVPENETLYVFIDELDRCKPDYALQLLERLKHYIHNSNVVFVVSIYKDVLSDMIKKTYGLTDKSEYYLFKFFNHKYMFPKISKLEYFYYLTGVNLDSHNYNDLTFQFAINHFDFSLRRINMLSNMYEKYKAFENGKTENGRTLNHYGNLYFPLMMSIYVSDINLFNGILQNGPSSRERLRDIIKSNEEFLRWFVGTAMSVQFMMFKKVEEEALEETLNRLFKLGKHSKEVEIDYFSENLHNQLKSIIGI